MNPKTLCAMSFVFGVVVVCGDGRFPLQPTARGLRYDLTC
jgi:hypothetical protein